MPPTDYQLSVSIERGDILARARLLIDQGGLSQAQAAASLGVSPAKLSRILRGGEAALVPATDKCGRKAAFTLDEAETAALRKLHLMRDSFALAVEEFAYAGACRPETRAQISAILDEAAAARRLPRWPESLRRAGHVTEHERAEFRGRKASQEVGFVDRRGMYWIDEAGARRDMLAHTIWESDDYSSNQPYTFRDPVSGEERICRQVLATLDVHSAAWLGMGAVGRERDAYRAEDILRHMLAVIDSVGTMPRVWRLERGRWENLGIHGISVPGLEGRWGGLDPLFTIDHVFSSGGKGTIENGFDILQAKLEHQALSLGRERGEMERQTREYLRARAGTISAQEAGIWTVERCMAAHREAAQALNARAKDRRALGVCVPEDLLQRAEATRPLPVGERWRFCPVKRVATVRGGHVELSVEGYARAFRFTVNGIEPGRHFDQGYRVLVAFDPALAAEGCHIFNGETGSRNRENLRLGERVLLAPEAEDRPQINLSGQRDPEDFAARKAARAAVRTEYVAIVGGRGQLSQWHDGERTARVDTLSGAGRQRPVPAGSNGEETQRRTPSTPPAPEPFTITRGERSTRPVADDEAELARLAAEEAELARNCGMIA